MQFGRRIAIHKSVKETNLIKLYFHSYGWFLLLFLNGMLCMIFSYRTLFFLCNLSILRAFAYSFISLFLALWSHFGYTECHFQAFILFALFVLCAILGVAVFLLCAADILLFRVFFTRFNGWWYEKHVLCILFDCNYCLRDSKYTIQLK